MRGNIKAWKAGRAWHFSIMHSGSVIGGIGIISDATRPYIAEIGYFIAREYHGRGFALQALEQTVAYARTNLPQLRRLQALIASGNLPSIRVATKAGFVQEGILREYLKIGDQYHDTCIFGLILR